ncbi:transcriptional regulator [Microbacterium sp. SS28]|uniref:ArsR/SmtB family transcription factor n=1 Tax=Microbacterium sp. SS28 TaxID=2919948 RepID=UPI001FAB13A3|nr:metalloregulator ArsR/SmtB family transcription factor [Microbacterium sp. SS28]
MSEQSSREIHVEDPSALRAMAHPLRLKIIGMLRSDGPLSVGALGERLGAASGSISYHLATLEKHGFVEHAPELARDGRERWWRASAEYTSFDPAELQADPARREAGVAFRRAIVQGYAAEQLAYLESEADLPAEWIAAATQSDDLLWVTAGELQELSDELEALGRRWHDRAGDRTRAGAEPVRLIYSAFHRP